MILLCRCLICKIVERIVTPPSEAYRVKGATFRAYVKVLKEEGKLAAVVARLSPDAAAAVRDLPLAGSWVDALWLVEIVEAIEALQGRNAALELGRQALTREMLPFFFPMIKAVMRIMG